MSIQQTLGRSRLTYGAAALGAAILIGTTLSACGSSTSADSSSSKIVFGDLVPNANLTPYYVAADEGFFQKQGLDVTTQKFTGGGSSSVAALATGAVDVAAGGPTNFIGAMAQKVIKGKLFGEVLDANYDVVTSKNITSIQDLAGKVIGVSGANSADQIYINAVLSHYGIDTKSVNYLTAGTPPERLTALSTNKIQAIVESDTVRTSSQQVGNVVLPAEKTPVVIPGVVFYADPSYLSSNAANLKKFVAAIVAATQWIQDPANLTKAVADCVSGSGATSDACKETIQFSLNKKNVGPWTWSSTYALNTQGLQDAIKATAALIPAASSLTLSDVADTSITGTKP